jgi:predicted nucleic acid-binding protein
MRLLLVDACVLINLVATGHIDEIVAANEMNLIAVEEVVEETLYIREAANPNQLREIDMNRLQAMGSVGVVRLERPEEEKFVEFAARLDDGEAATLAVAMNRSLTVATDDRAALRLIVELNLEVETVSTADLLRGWADSDPDAGEIIVEALRKIERLASFRPNAADPNHNWWRALCDVEVEGGLG